MTWYPKWVVALEDIRTSPTPVEMTPRIAELIVSAIQKQTEDLGRARARIHELEEELRRERRAAQGPGLASR